MEKCCNHLLLVGKYPFRTHFSSNCTSVHVEYTLHPDKWIIIYEFTRKFNLTKPSEIMMNVYLRILLIDVFILAMGRVSSYSNWRLFVNRQFIIRNWMGISTDQRSKHHKLCIVQLVGHFSHRKCEGENFYSIYSLPHHEQIQFTR